MAKKKSISAINKTLSGVSCPPIESMQYGKAGYVPKLTQALYYVDQSYDLEQRKGFVQEWIIRNNLKIDISQVSAFRFSSLGSLCWLNEQGLNDTTTNRIKSILMEIIKKHEEKDEESKNSVKHKQQTSKIKSRTSKQVKTDNVMDFIEGFFDDCLLKKTKGLKNPIDIFNNNEGFDNKHLRSVVDSYVKELTIEDSYICPDTNKKVKDKTNVDVKFFSKVYKLVLDHLDSYEKKTSKRKTKSSSSSDDKIPKPKKIIPSKMVSRLNYLKVCETYNISSISPVSNMIGKDAVFVFNTKTKRLTRFVSCDSIGILVKGSTVYNFDADDSCEKLLKSPHESFGMLNNCSKVSQRKFMDTIKGKEKTPSGRINQHCIILKAF